MGSSGKQSDLGQPFGYLKASTTLTCVNLFVMPYNYPVLLPLLGEMSNTDVSCIELESGDTMLMLIQRERYDTL